MYKFSISIIFVLLAFSAFQLVNTFAQETETTDETDWREINKLTREFWSAKESDSEEIGKKLITALEKYLDNKNLETDRDKIALSLLISVYKHNSMHKEIIKFTNNFVTDKEKLIGYVFVTSSCINCTW